jgi:phosphoribosyl-ATP pyrophosphohydrolase
LIDSIRQKIRNFWEGSTEIKEKYFDKNFDKMTQKVGEKATELKDNFDNIKEETVKDKK